MNREKRISKVRRVLDGRRLVWFGTRGTDAASLACLPELKYVFSLKCPLKGADGVEQYCLEQETRMRVDANLHDLEKDKSVELRIMREKMLSVLQAPSVLITYCASSFVDSVFYPRKGTAAYWGLFHLRQQQFDYKPWVESCLKAIGVKVLPWRYYSGKDIPALADEIRQSSLPYVLREIHSYGGSGLIMVERPDDLEQVWPAQTDGFLSAAPYLQPNVSLSINGCIYGDGSVRLFSPSVQLLGLEICTNNKLAYCGNDFGAVKAFGGEVMDGLEDIAARIGAWLWQNGYRGAFGADVVLYQNQLLLAEINPRFLGSSPLSAVIAERTGVPAVYTEHVAAFAGLTPPKRIPLSETVKEQPAISQVICFNRGSEPVHGCSDRLEAGDGVSAHEVAPPHIAVAPQGELFKCVFEGSVTGDGHAFVGKAGETVNSLVSQWTHGRTS